MPNGPGSPHVDARQPCEVLPALAGLVFQQGLNLRRNRFAGPENAGPYRTACLVQILLVRPGGWQTVLPCGAFELPPGNTAPDVAGKDSPPQRAGMEFGVWSLEMNKG